MLSKVAERIYWTARYIERVENTARLLGVYANLLLDLPKGVHLGWFNLIELNSAQTHFGEFYKTADERSVVKFILGDENNPSSMVSSLRMLRENVRTSRDVVPGETWELVNALTMFVQDNLSQALNREQRHGFLKGVIRGCQQVNGLMYGTMSHDKAWDFLRLGRNLERADMTTRILDIGVATWMQTQKDDGAIYAKQIIWGNVLRSVGAEQSYRRSLRAAVEADDVARYLLEDEQFPRTIKHCLQSMDDSACKLPLAEPVILRLAQLQSSLFVEVDYQTLDESFREYLNAMQLELAQLHSSIADTWFN
ncbi:MAG: hypothetical protein RL497_2124 [Pseudomonadota bacterium]